MSWELAVCIVGVAWAMAWASKTREIKIYRPAVENPVSWVSVDESMPVARVDVLVFDEGGNMFISYHKCGFWRDYRVGNCRYSITHWCLLPESPVEVKA